MRPARTTLAIAAACAAAAVAGCGGDDSAGPLDAALGYLPEDAPLAIAVSTDTEGGQYESAGRIVERFPFGEQAIQSLEQELGGGEVDFQDDIRPLLGNELVIGVPDAESLTAEDAEGFIAAIDTEDGDKLTDLIEQNAEKVGEESGATIYEAERDGTVAAVEDGVLVLSDDRQTLERALQQRDDEGRLGEETFEDALADLPEDAVARLYVNVASLLEADPSTATARKVEWVDALRTVGLTASIEDDALALDFVANTEEGELSPDELPIGAGGQAPGVIGQEGEIGVGVRDLAQIVRFAERVGQAVSPQQFAEYQTAKRQIAQGLNVDLDRDLIAQFGGDTAIAIDPTGGFAVRAELENPSAFEQTLERLADVIPSFAEGAGLGEVAVAEPDEGEDFYAVAREDGEGVVFGVVDGVFVMSDDADRAASVAAEQPQQVQGAEGAIVVRADAEQVANQIIGQIGGLEAFGAGAFTAPLGLLTGSIEAGDDALRGNLRLAIEDGGGGG